MNSFDDVENISSKEIYLTNNFFLLIKLFKKLKEWILANFRMKILTLKNG